MTELANYSIELERAHAAQAVYEHAAFQAHGLGLDLFAGGECRAIVQAAQDAWEAGEGGLDGVLRALQRAGKLDTVGGRQGLLALLAEGGAPDADELRRLARLRAIEATAIDAARVARAGDLAGAISRLQSAADVCLTSKAVVKTGVELSEALLDGIVNKSSTKAMRVYPGIQQISDAVGDLSVGSLTVIGAGTGVGKSRLALEMLLGLAQRGVAAGLIGLEDPEEVTGSRYLGALSGVNSRAIQVGTISHEDYPRLEKGVSAVRKIGANALFADVTGGTDIDVRAAMSIMAQRGAKLIAVDYLQEIQGSDAVTRKRGRANEISWVATQLKTHAKRIGVALVLVSQLSRPSDKRAGQMPNKYWLKETGDIENKSEVIILLWEEEGVIKVKIDKGKAGGGGAWWPMRTDSSGRLVSCE